MNIADRVARKVELAPDGCWIWTGARDRKGYGSIKVAGRALGVHRVAYEALVGPIPAGLQLDHLCRVPACCNPAHLEPVTAAENRRRGMHPSAVLSRENRCARGHDLADAYVTNTGRRQCRICMAARKRRERKRLSTLSRQEAVTP